MILHILAVVGALSLTSCSLLLVWAWLCGRARQRHEAEIFAALCEAVERHPAGNRRDEPFRARATCCGSRIYGDTLADVGANYQFHLSQCPALHHRRDAA